jgi:hypothetical protein
MHATGKHDFSESEHEARYTLATGFAYFYRDHMWLGIDAAWDAYADEIIQWRVAPPRREVSESQQTSIVNAYIAYGCHESPAMSDSRHAADVRNNGTCGHCGQSS